MSADATALDPVTPVIEARAVSKVYRAAQDVRAVDDVSVVVRRREALAIVGPSGSGKSTLLHLLGALDAPSSGDVLFEGRSVAGMTDDERTLLRRRRIGFVFQFFSLVPYLTAAENIALPGRLDRWSEARRRARGDELLELLGVADRRDHLPAHLSGGERQRVAIGRALFASPAVVLADEPTGRLDSVASETVLDVLMSLREGGQTVVVVTHDPAVAARADRTIHIQDGRLREARLGRRRRSATAR